jgi:antirestriction protein
MIGINKIRPFKAFIASEQRSIKDWEALVRHFLDTYIGEYASREDYAKAYLNEGSEFEKIPPFLRGYFDYFLYARELFSSVVYDLKAQRGIYVFLSCKPVSD